jgi:hypothetical protein
MLARCEADFCRVRALYAEADREYKEALRCFDRAQREEDTLELQKNRARLFLNFGELRGTRNQLSEWAKSNQKVIEICELALSVATDDVNFMTSWLVPTLASET